MHTCVIEGDMSSDKTSENYPSVTYCDECFAELDENSYVHDSGYDPSISDTCESCGKTEQEERDENEEE